MEAAADGAAALRAIGIAAEDARFDAALEVGGIVGGEFGEDAIIGIGWGIDEGFRETFVEEHFGVALGESGEFLREDLAVVGREALGAFFADLRSVDADPEAVYFFAGIPKLYVLFEVAGALEHLACDGPVDVDFATMELAEDFFVGCGLTANVVVFGKTVDGDGDSNAWKRYPLERDGDDAAGDDQSKDAHFAEDGENLGEFAMADERFAAD